LAFATSRLNWSCPLKTVLNGNRDWDANAPEQIKQSRTSVFKLRMTLTIQRGIRPSSTLSPWINDEYPNDEARRNDEESSNVSFELRH
jgi:hypothetical protein